MNQLANELSPYLLGHASNPVNWYPWSETPFNIAKKHNKPIFLSIGYSACHWCHVMEKESFLNENIANLLNENFISIKVDREERPDIDKIYMDALLSMTGSGGWPMSMFITPDGKPFYGGTYYPPQSRYGLPGFSEILFSILNAWNDNRDDLLGQATRITTHLNRSINVASNDLKGSMFTFESISQQFMENYDSRLGGWGVRPKFPHSLALDLLILHNKNITNETGKQITHTLEQMALGGFHDLLRGGFHRYSTDQNWLVPHFEKMLYDNALLSKTYLYAGLTGHSDSFLDISKSTLNFIKSELLDTSGGFWSSMDADSEGEEGLYYLWSYEELRNNFSEDDWKIFTHFFNISESGNFEGKIILRKNENNNFSFDLQKLFKVQENRIRPQTDNKVLLDWNALTLSAFAIAGKYLSNNEYVKIAENNAEFIISHMYVSGRLYHTWKNGQYKQKAFLSDYAFLIIGLYDLFLTTLEHKWYTFANSLLDDMVNLFWNDDQFFDTGNDQIELIIRPKTIEDNVVPSGWSAAIQAIQKFNFISGNSKYSELINISIRNLIPTIKKHPFAYPNWINIILNLEQIQNFVVIIKHPDDIYNSKKLEYFCKKYTHPDTILVIVPENNSKLEYVDFLKDKKTVNQLSTVYVCKNGVCSIPINQVDVLSNILKIDLPAYL